MFPTPFGHFKNAPGKPLAIECNPERWKEFALFTSNTRFTTGVPLVILVAPITHAAWPSAIASFVASETAFQEGDYALLGTTDPVTLPDASEVNFYLLAPRISRAADTGTEPVRVLLVPVGGTAEVLLSRQGKVGCYAPNGYWDATWFITNPPPSTCSCLLNPDFEFGKGESFTIARKCRTESITTGDAGLVSGEDDDDWHLGDITTNPISGTVSFDVCSAQQIDFVFTYDRDTGSDNDEVEIYLNGSMVTRLTLTGLADPTTKKYTLNVAGNCESTVMVLGYMPNTRGGNQHLKFKITDIR